MGQEVSVDLDAAALLTTELASNAARHGGEPIGMSVSVEEGELRVSVHDHGSGFDPADENIRSSGSGVRLVEALASDWGVEHDDEGTEVWFKI